MAQTISNDVSIDLYGKLTGTVVEYTVGEILNKMPLIGLAIGVSVDLIEYQRNVALVSRYRNEYNFSDALGLLGAYACFSNVDGNTILHGINFNTYQFEWRYEGFIKSTNLGLSRDQLIECVLQGNPNDQVYTMYVAFAEEFTYDNYLGVQMRKNGEYYE